MTIYNNIFLFGAGASFGSGESTIYPTNPPLGNCLAKSLAERYDIWRVYYGLFPAEQWEDFEGTFEKLISQDANILILFRNLAHFFTNFHVLNSDNLYSKLINMLHLSELLNSTVFSTLNYDNIFEQAVKINGFKVECINDPNSTNEIMLMKLHGSATFKLHSDNFNSSHVLFPPWFKIDAPLQEMTIEDAQEYYSDKQDMFIMPPMCMYTPDKKSNIANNAIQNIQRRYTEIVSKVSRIFIIGASASLHDKHVWNPIKDSTANIYYCGSDKDFNKIKVVIGAKRCRYIGTTFDSFLQNFNVLIAS